MSLGLKETTIFLKARKCGKQVAIISFKTSPSHSDYSLNKKKEKSFDNLTVIRSFKTLLLCLLCACQDSNSSIYYLQATYIKSVRNNVNRVG